VNLPCGPVGGVRVEDSLGAGSLILIHPAFLPTTFLGFFRGGGAVASFHLPARVLGDPALRLADETSIDSVLGSRAEIGTARIGSSCLKPGIVKVKLSMTCRIAYAENEYSRKNLRTNEILPYHIPLHSEMVGANLLRCRPAASIAKHVLHEFQHLTDLELVD
jgi:hypothetical protein